MAAPFPARIGRQLGTVLRRRWLRMALIAAIGLVTVAVDHALPHFGPTHPFAPLYFSSLMVASIGHTREALAAVFGMALLAAYWLPPDDSLAIDRAEDVASELVYALVASLLAFVIPSLRSARQRAERAYAALRHSEERYRRIVETAQEGIWEVDVNFRTTYVNQKMADLLGYGVEELRGVPFLSLIEEEHRMVAREYLERGRRHAGDGHDLAYRRNDGTVLWAHVAANALFDTAGRYTGALAMVADITERKRAEDALRHQALYDPLTGLPNRALLTDRIGRALPLAQRARTPAALLLLDLDRFKEVNDTFGHHHGDLLLRQLAERISAALRPSDTVARLGGDEFAVLLPGDDAEGAVAAATRIHRVLDDPFVVETQPLHVKASIGIALFPDHGPDTQTLLRHADIAMYVAKRGGDDYAMYAPEQDAYSRDRIALVTELRRACAERQFALHYQPITDMATGRLSHVEALVRWTHPERGPVRPDVFIPLAEEMGLIGPVTTCVLHEALGQCQRWRQRGLHVAVAANLSMLNLRDPAMAATILGLLRRYDVPASALRIELTETSIMSDQVQTVAVLAALGAAGVRISVDDFGTGYSSLAYLRRLPVDEIKIDRSFVMDMARDEADAAIVRSTISMAHALGLRVVAEGVETRQVWELLKQLGCDAVQGYYVSRPLPALELEGWLRGERLA